MFQSGDIFLKKSFRSYIDIVNGVHIVSTKSVVNMEKKSNLAIPNCLTP